MKKIIFVLLVLMLAGCGSTKNYYNVSYSNGTHTIVYHDVTNVNYYRNSINFTTDDGKIVILSGGVIEITKLDLN